MGPLPIVALAGGAVVVASKDKAAKALPTKVPPNKELTTQERMAASIQGVVGGTIVGGLTGVGIGATRAQPRLQLGKRGRQDEDAHRLRHQRAHLRRTLGVDVEHDVAVGVQLRLDPAAQRAITVPVYLGVLKEFAGGDAAAMPMWTPLIMR